MNTKIYELCKRVYNNKLKTEVDKEGNVLYSDESDIKSLCQKTFGDGSTTPDPSALHSFNNIIVKLADEIAQPRVEEMMKFFVTYQKANRGDIVKYKIPKNNIVKVKWVALGSGVDHIRINPAEKAVIATPTPLQFGAYYEPLDMVQDSVNKFREAVNKVADAKVEMYFTKVMELLRQAVADTKIPASQVKQGASVTLADYSKIENRLIRFGGRPVMVGDYLLIDKLAREQVTDAYYSKLLTDKVKEGLLEDLRATAFSKTIAININNPFIDEENSKVKFDVNEAFVFAGGDGNKSPIYITEFGGMRQQTMTNYEDERVHIKITLEADITLLSGRKMGYIKDTSVVL